MSTTGFSTAVLICGAGASGLALAIDLARRGVPARVIDRLAAPFPGSRGKGIQPRTQEILEDLGVLDRIAAAGGRYPVQRAYADDGSFTDTDDLARAAPSPAEPYGEPLLCPQFLTERVLRERLAEFGRAPEFGRELVSLEQDADGVTARVGDEVIRARFVVGADGGRSTVRHLLGVGFPGKTLGVRAVVADLELPGFDRGAWHRYHDGDLARQLSLCPLVGTDLVQLQAPVPLDGDVDVSAAGLAALIEARAGRALPVARVAWASVYQMNARLADRYRVGRVLLAGDAAHIHPPTGGQGLNTSIQDAYNLGWKLAATIDRDNGGASGVQIDALLDTYEAERRPIAAGMLGLSTQLLDAARRGDHRRGRETHQLDLGYPGSPLALEDPPRAAGAVLYAGDRAPDAPVRGAGGQLTRLFALFAGPHWTLLGYRADRAALAAAGVARAGVRVHVITDVNNDDNSVDIGVDIDVGIGADLVDVGGHVRAAYGTAPGDWVLIRPDGYVGAIVAAGREPALAAYLDAYGGYGGCGAYWKS